MRQVLLESFLMLAWSLRKGRLGILKSLCGIGKAMRGIEKVMRGIGKVIVGICSPDDAYATRTHKLMAYKVTRCMHSDNAASHKSKHTNCPVRKPQGFHGLKPFMIGIEVICEAVHFLHTSST